MMGMQLLLLLIVVAVGRDPRCVASRFLLYVVLLIDGRGLKM
jgi:hypothetical protein